MSKILAAEINGAGKLVIGGAIVEGIIFSEAKAPSEGIAVIEVDKVFYLTSNASDIKTLIERMVSAIDKIITIATGLDGVTNSPGAQTANIAQLTTIKTQLNASKDVLK